jgi:TatD DNase family protein
MISLPGVITFSDLDKSIKKIPLSRIMSETDSPFAAPKPFRGKTNTPLYVPEIVKKIAEVKNIKENEMEKIILENTFNFFNIK